MGRGGGGFGLVNTAMCVSSAVVNDDNETIVALLWDHSAVQSVAAAFGLIRDDWNAAENS